MLSKLLSVNFCIISALFFYSSLGQECSINIQKDLLSKSPIFLKNDMLHVPTGPFLVWKAGEESELICSGAKNSLVNEKNTSAKMKCVSNNKLTINGKVVNLNKLECSALSTGEIIKTKKSCAKDGTLHEIGFYTSDKYFVKYIEVCYNLDNGSVIYTRHIIPGQSISHSIKESKRPSFSVKGVPKHVKPNTSYKQSAQFERFTELLGPKSAETYLNSSSFLARGHLSPDKDGIFRSWQYATYFYLNVAPQWQSINAINWLRVENLSRKKAADLKDDLEIVTGNSGILTLKNDIGKQVPLSLEDDYNILVPKYYWKVLKHKNAAIAFVSLNNPFENSKEVCKNICEKYNWPTNEFDVLEKGIIYCCSIPDLMKAFPNDVPKDLLTKNILSY